MTQINTDKLITLKKSVIIGFIVSIIFGVIGIVFGFLGNLYIGDGHDNIFTVIAIPFFVIPMVTFVNSFVDGNNIPRIDWGVYWESSLESSYKEP